MMFILFWIILSILVGVYANSKGRSGIGYTLLALILSPLIVLLILLILSPVEDNLVKKGDLKKCPFCKELIRIDAITCKHCGKDISKESIPYVTNEKKRTFRKEFKNNTFFIIIENYEKLEINIAKEQLSKQYKEKGYDTISVDNESIWQLKSSTYPKTYVQITWTPSILRVEAYNVQEKPLILDDLSPQKPENSNNTDKLIELSKMLKDGLITKEEFDKYKSEIS